MNGGTLASDAKTRDAQRRLDEKRRRLGITGAASDGGADVHHLRPAETVVEPQLLTSWQRRQEVDRDAAQAKAPTEKKPKKEKPPPEEDVFLSELEAVAAEPHYRDTLLPDGALVEVIFRSVAENTIVGGARKWLTLLDVHQVPAPHDQLVGGGVILRSWNPPRGRYLSPWHALYADWLAVVGRPIRTLPRRFTGNALLRSFLTGTRGAVIVKARTRVVTEYHDPRTKTTVRQERYSVIDCFLGRSAGTPRVLHPGVSPRAGPQRTLAEPKTSRARRQVDIPGFAIVALRRHREALGALPHPERLVFVSPEGEPIRRSNLHRRSFKPLLAKAKLPAVTFHALRHSAATLALAAGVNPKVVQERLGHSSVTLTLDTYSHAVPTLGKDAAARLDSLLGTSS
jgi:hypothetical protein